MDWLHRKAEENAHNEILAFLLIILGVNLLIGGLLAVIIVVGEPVWLLVFPYTPPKTPSIFLRLILTLAGFALTSAGFVLVIHYDRKKSWYIKELEKSVPRKVRTTPQSISEILEEYTGKRKKGECFEKICQKLLGYCSRMENVKSRLMKTDVIYIALNEYAKNNPRI